MLKTITGLLPWALVLIVFAGITWFLLERNIALGRWLFGAFLVGHGFVHLMFLIPQQERAAATANGVEYPFDMGRSWLVGGGAVDVGLARIIGTVLAVVVALGYMLAGLSTAGLLVPTDLWPGLVVGSTAASVLLLALFYGPGLLLGFGIDVVLLWLVLGSIWTPASNPTIA